MDAFSLIVGLAAGILIGVILAGLRRTPRLGGAPEPSAARQGEPGTDPAGIAATRDAEGRLHLTRRIVRHEARAVVGPTGTTFEVDGTAYDSVDDIPDPTTREHLRSLLAEAPSRVANPAARERLVEELHDAGVDAPPAVGVPPAADATPVVDAPPADAPPGPDEASPPA